MPGRLGPRFALEALFLIALAVGAAFADLDARWIAAIMAAGWVIVALLEWTAERLWATLPPWRRPYYSVGTPVAAPPPLLPPVEPEPEPELLPEPQPQLLPEPVPVAVAAVREPEPEPEPVYEPEPETMIVSPVEPQPEREPEPEPVAEAEPVAEPEPAAEADPQPEPELQPERPRLEPLEPRPKRRWFRRSVDGEPEAEHPSPPKHVRLLPVTPHEDGDEDGLLDSERREHTR
jgi:hypothetical protein